MIMSVHIPFADLANTIALFNWVDADYLMYNCSRAPRNVVSCMIKGNLAESEERIIQMTEGTSIRFSFSDYKGEEAKSFIRAFGKKVLCTTRHIDPNGLGGIAQERLLT